MKKICCLIIVLLFIFYSTFLFIEPILVHADEIDDLQKQIDDLSKARELSINATKPLEGELDSLKVQLAQIQIKINILSSNIIQKQKELNVREDNLVIQQALLSSRVRSYYIRSFLSSPIMMIFSSNGSSDLLRDLFYRQMTTIQDQKVISAVSSEMIDLSNQKDILEKNKKQVASLQSQLDQNAKFLTGEIGKAKAYQTNLSNQISQLSAKQQAILAAKNGTFTTSVGDVPLADDPKARPDYNPGFSPAFAMFSFGAYSHRNGMSQYGAKGRADAGQSAETILSAYYPGSTLNKGYSVPSTITVSGFGAYSTEDYVKRIYEMPNSFPMEALKAQAVAARTYAIRYTNKGSTPICADEGCQVFKSGDKGGAWDQAVDATRGWVLEGGPSAQYSSTTGGYLNTSGWDTKCGNQSCWTPDAFEKLAGSPWFYKSWYTQSYDISSATCGRSSPWLHENEMADILNAYLIQNKSGVDNGRITPLTTSCWGGNPYSMDEAKSLADSAGGGAVTSVSFKSVSYSTGGYTSNVTFSTNRGDVSINGADFKTIYNLRGPGYISIKSPLFNIEHK